MGGEAGLQGTAADTDWCKLEEFKGCAEQSLRKKPRKFQ